MCGAPITGVHPRRESSDAPRSTGSGGDLFSLAITRPRRDRGHHMVADQPLSNRTVAVNVRRIPRMVQFVSIMCWLFALGPDCTYFTSVWGVRPKTLHLGPHLLGYGGAGSSCSLATLQEIDNTCNCILFEIHNFSGQILKVSACCLLNTFRG